jgi:hypothetical protein
MNQRNNRRDDERINTIESLVKEIHQRQIEITLPMIEEMKNTVYGNGKPGLCDAVSRMDTKINMTAWIFGIAISCLGVLVAILEYLYKVRH